VAKKQPKPAAKVVTPEQLAEAPGDPESYAFVFEQAEGVVRRQEASVDELRARVGIILPVAIGVAGLFLQSILSRPHLDWLAWAGIVAGLVGFGVGFGVSIWIIRPYQKWAFGMDAKVLIEGYVEAPSPATLAAMQKRVALYLAEAAATNKEKLDKFYRYFQVVLVAFVVETSTLLFALWRSYQ
jgi:hypothetical protein